MGRGGGGGGSHHSSHHSSSHTHHASSNTHHASSSSYHSSGSSSYRSGSSRYSGGSSGGSGGGGCFSTFVTLIVMAVIAGGVYFGLSDEIPQPVQFFLIERSTENREALPESKCTPVDVWYQDDWGDWIDEEGEEDALIDGMKSFYESTGVQPYLWITGEDGGQYESAQSLEDLAEAKYKELFGIDEGHMIVIFREYPNNSSEYICTVTPGYDAETQVLDEQAREILLDFIDYFYTDTDLNEGYFFKYSFKNEAEKKKYEDEFNQAYDTYNKQLYNGGYRIYTSLDSKMQGVLQDAIDSGLDAFDEVDNEGIYELQGAAVCIDNDNGFVKAIVGGRTQDIAGYTLNRGYQSFRQPGSTIKPLIVYTPLLERGYTADTTVVDQPIKDGPTNADKSYSGSMSLRRAVQLSKNTVAWSLFERITPKAGLAYLKNMEFTALDERDETLAAALGGFTIGVSPVEMAKGYATIENDGMYRQATCVKKITDFEGNTIYQSEQQEKEVYKENAARAMTDILQSVVTSGTAAGLGVKNQATAGKTGTTNDNKDGWFCGYTPYYTTAVWVGYDMPKKLPGLYGSSYPGEIWSRYMNAIHNGLEHKDFLGVTQFIGEVTTKGSVATNNDEGGEEAPPEEEQQ